MLSNNPLVKGILIGVGVSALGFCAYKHNEEKVDDFLRRHPEAAIDYIHGEDVVRRLCQAPDAIGFLLPPLDKSDFFPAIQRLGVLPRKTFSMGHAHEKRFYMECKAITD